MLKIKNSESIRGESIACNDCFVFIEEGRRGHRLIQHKREDVYVRDKKIIVLFFFLGRARDGTHVHQVRKYSNEYYRVVLFFTIPSQVHRTFFRLS